MASYVSHRLHNHSHHGRVWFLQHLKMKHLFVNLQTLSHSDLYFKLQGYVLMKNTMFIIKLQTSSDERIINNHFNWNDDFLYLFRTPCPQSYPPQSGELCPPVGVALSFRVDVYNDHRLDVPPQLCLPTWSQYEWWLQWSSHLPMK